MSLWPSDKVAAASPRVETVAGRGSGSLPPRSARLPEFIGVHFGSVDAAIGQLKIAHIGVGAVGRQTAIQIARLGVAWQFMVDPGRYKRESLLTQPIGPEDVGRPKASNAAEFCKRVSPGTRVQYYDGPLQDLDPMDFEEIDVLVVATDNLRAEVHAAQLARHLGKVLIHAGVHGETLTAQVSLFSNASSASPCLVCGYGPQDWRLLNGEVRFSCEGAKLARPVARTIAQPTTSLAALCALAGEMAVLQLVRDVAGLGASVRDTVLEYNGVTHRTVISPLGRHARCPVEHAPWVRASASAPLPDCTLATLFRDAGLALTGRSTVRVEQMPFVARGVCERGHIRRVGRFMSFDGPAVHCRDCRALVQPHPFHVYRAAPEELLAPYLHHTLGSLCGGLPRWVVVQQAERAVLLANK